MTRLRGALGLRGRIAGAVFFSAVVTLAVAALALLGPLEHSLRKAEIASLKHDLGAHPAAAFAKLPLCTDYTDQHGERLALGMAELRLAHKIGGVVVVLGDAGTNGEHAVVLPFARPATVPSDAATDIAGDHFQDAAIAFRTGKPYSSSTAILARRVIPFTKTCPLPGGSTVRKRYVLAVRKSIAEIPAVAHVVRRAFFDAALTALALTILLGIPLSGRLVRRLRRLSQVAVEIEHDAPMIVPADMANDEVGDLARALATMQERLGRQEEARRLFVATASHELRTPLASLNGMLELLSEDLAEADPDVADARSLLARARAQSERLARLAADLLDLSRIDAQVQLRSEPVELGELSRAVLAEFEHSTAERRIESALVAAEGHPVWAVGDPGSIARIMRILLDNAVRASPPDSHITVSLSDASRPGAAIVTVSDEGPGIRDEERESIFARFSRGKDTAGQAGFGLGLAIGRELARRMGGDLVLEDGGGRDDAGGNGRRGALGARFTLSLPPAPTGTLTPESDPLPVG